MLFISEKHGVTIDLSILNSIQCNPKSVTFYFRTSEGVAIPPIVVTCNTAEDAKSLHSDATKAFSKHNAMFPI